MKKSKLSTVLVITIILVSLFASASIIEACVESLDHIVISPKSAIVVEGQSQAFLLTAYAIDNQSWVVEDQQAVWSVNSGEGTFVWSGSSVVVNKTGIWTVTATYQDKTATATLTVIPSNASKIDRITATIDPATVEAPNIAVGTATAYDTNGNSWDISTLATWSIPAGGDGGTWRNNVYTSHTAGTYTVQAMYEGKTASTSLTVTHSTDRTKLASLTITPSTAQIAAGNPQSYKATANDTLGNSWDATTDISASKGWSISSGAGGSWSGANYTSEKAGQWTVTGTYITKTASATLNVTHATDQAHLDHITASMDPNTVAAPNKATGTATAYDTFGNTWDVSAQATWSIPAGNDGGSWQVNNYTSSKAGTYTIQATYSGKDGTTSLTVTHATDVKYLDHITASLNATTVAVPNAVMGLATAYDTFGNSWDISTAATWSIPAGNDGGSWAANVYTSRKAGIYTVQAQYQSKTATAILNVTHAVDMAYLDHITAFLNATTIAAPDIVTGNATAYDSFGNSWDISTLATWTIPAGTDGGSWSKNIYTSHTAGAFTVQAAYNSKVASTSLTVTHATDEKYLDHIVISPKQSTVNIGNPQSYTTTAYDSVGNSWSVTATYSCSSLNVVIANNFASSNVAGSYTITATYGGKSDSAILNVNAASQVDNGDSEGSITISITVSPKIVAIEAGSSQSFKATASNGKTTWDATNQVTWSVDSMAGGSWIQSSGTYTSNNTGRWTIKATLDKLSDTATLTVNAKAALLHHIAISPKSTDAVIGSVRNFTTTAYDQFGNSLGDVTPLTDFFAPGASVEGNLVTAISAGSYTVTATYKGLSDTATLRVNDNSVPLYWVLGFAAIIFIIMITSYLIVNRNRQRKKQLNLNVTNVMQP